MEKTFDESEKILGKNFSKHPQMRSKPYCSAIYFAQ